MLKIINHIYKIKFIFYAYFGKPSQALYQYLRTPINLIEFSLVIIFILVIANSKNHECY